MMNQAHPVPTNSKQILNDSVNLQNSLDLVVAQIRRKCLGCCVAQRRRGAGRADFQRDNILLPESILRSKLLLVSIILSSVPGSNPRANRFVRLLTPVPDGIGRSF